MENFFIKLFYENMILKFIQGMPQNIHFVEELHLSFTFDNIEKCY